MLGAMQRRRRIDVHAADRIAHRMPAHRLMPINSADEVMSCAHVRQSVNEGIDDLTTAIVRVVIATGQKSLD